VEFKQILRQLEETNGPTLGMSGADILHWVLQRYALEVLPEQREVILKIIHVEEQLPLLD
jgi:hypothetical protein